MYVPPIYPIITHPKAGILGKIYKDGVARYVSAERDDMFRRAILSTDATLKTYHLVDLYITPSLSKLEISPDASRSLTVENAGGKSALSEMLSIDYFSRVFGAAKVALEMEVEYWIDYKMVDYVCSIEETRVGVSVTRAMGFPTPSDFTPEQAEILVGKKLNGLIIARNAVTKKHRFFRSVLHVWCQNTSIGRMVRDAYSAMEATLEIKGVMLLLITICDNPEIYIFDTYRASRRHPSMRSS